MQLTAPADSETSKSVLLCWERKRRFGRYLLGCALMRDEIPHLPVCVEDCIDCQLLVFAIAGR